jgi:predicted nucleic acid-binding protein
VLADTDFFIDLMTPAAAHHERAVERKDAIDREATPVSMSAVTRFELFTGIERFSDPGPERRRVQRVVERFPTISVTPSVADRAGKVHGGLVAKGAAIGARDAMIAATALESDLPVLTRNVDEFRRIQGLKVETY